MDEILTNRLDLRERLTCFLWLVKIALPALQHYEAQKAMVPSDLPYVVVHINT